MSVRRGYRGLRRPTSTTSTWPTFPRVGNGKGFRSGKANVEDVLMGTAPDQAADILEAFRQEPFDLFVTDHLAFGVVLAGEILGIPWASVAVIPLSFISKDLPPPGVPVSPGKGHAERSAVVRAFRGTGCHHPLHRRARPGFRRGGRSWLRPDRQAGPLCT
jgi:hypothetical protein